MEIRRFLKMERDDDLWRFSSVKNHYNRLFLILIKPSQQHGLRMLVLFWIRNNKLWELGNFTNLFKKVNDFIPRIPL